MLSAIFVYNVRVHVCLCPNTEVTYSTATTRSCSFPLHFMVVFLLDSVLSWMTFTSLFSVPFEFRFHESWLSHCRVVMQAFILFFKVEWWSVHAANLNLVLEWKSSVCSISVWRIVGGMIEWYYIETINIDGDVLSWIALGLKFLWTVLRLQVSISEHLITSRQMTSS